MSFYGIPERHSGIIIRIVEVDISLGITNCNFRLMPNLEFLNQIAKSIPFEIDIEEE